MTPEEFRRYGHEAVDWIADYWATLGERPVQPPVEPGQIAALLPAQAPERGESMDDILADLDRVVLPGMTHWQHPGFYAYFPANTSGPSVLGDLISSGLGVQGMLWATGPAATEVETVVLDWLADLLGLPAKFRSSGSGGGVIQDSASSAALVATLAALHRASGGTWRREGVTGGRYAVYTSVHGHSSIEKAARIAGLGDASVRMVPVDPRSLAMDPAALADLMAADRVAGITPTLVVATIGTTSSTAVDPLPEIGPICREYGAWLHVDAAYAGSAAVCPELRDSHAGLEHADSYCMDPHKWLLTGFDCDAFWVADRAGLIGALTVLRDYLANSATESGAVIDYRDWQVPLGRRFRALKLWFVLRWYGADGLRAHVRSGVALARELAGWIEADPRFEIAAPVRFSLVCFRLRAAPGTDGDARNADLLRRINGSGAVRLSQAGIGGRFTLRMAIGSPWTTRHDVVTAWALVQAAAGSETA